MFGLRSAQGRAVLAGVVLLVSVTSIAITLDTYSHILPNLQEEAARDLDAWLSSPKEAFQR
jgi:hypothetical protein